MKRILFVAVVLCFGISALAADLEISVTPQNPLLIPVSSRSSTPLAPYFALNSLKIQWKGTQPFELDAITLTSKSLQSFYCGGSGSNNTEIFMTSKVQDCNGNVIQPAINGNGNVIIPPPVNPSCAFEVESSSGFYCDEIKMTVSPNPMASYNIPVTVTVFGETLDSSGSSAKRVVASQ